MKNISLLVLLMIVVFLGCENLDEGVDEDTIFGSGNVVTIEKDFIDFIRIDISSTFEATITQADTYGVQVRIDDNIEEYLHVVKEDEVLRIYLTSGKNYKEVTLEAEITLPDLETLFLSGASKATLNRFDFNHDFAFLVSGASIVSGTLNMGAGGLDILLSGASNITLDGNCKDLIINASGVSILELREFVCVNATVILSGVSQATINVDENLNATVSGVSTLYYYGNPTLGSITSSGESIIQRLGPRKPTSFIASN